VNVESIQVDQSKAIAGIIIQKLFEIFVNSRVYRRPEMSTYEDILNWFDKNTRALFKLIARPLEDQYLSKFKNVRKFFKSKRGLGELEGIRKKYDLDSSITPPQITFINWDILEDSFGSEEGFFKHMNKLYDKNLKSFIEEGFILDRVLSEVYIQVKIDNVILNGYIDFLYNRNQINNFFDDVKKLYHGFMVLDGKYHVTRYVDKEQLQFYTSLLYAKHKKLPGEDLAFIDWSRAKFSFRKFDYAYYERLRQAVYQMKCVYNNVELFLNQSKSDIILLEDIISCKEIGLNYTASTACVFCPIRLCCASAIARKDDLERYTSAIANKRETKKYLKEEGVPLDQPPQDITF
jgi:hypothetical protein